MADKKNLFKVLEGLRHFGVGTTVTRNIYKFPETYWIITRVKLTKDQLHGSVYGRLIWRGKPKEKDEKITSALKKQWSMVKFPDYSKFQGRQAEIEALVPKNTTRSC